MNKRIFCSHTGLLTSTPPPPLKSEYTKPKKVYVTLPSHVLFKCPLSEVIDPLKGIITQEFFWESI